MVLFRCTEKTLKRFRLQVEDGSTVSEGLLGDWYANLLNVGRLRLVLCLNERSLLPVFVPARQDAFPSAFPAALRAVLSGLGIARERIDAEVESCRVVAFGRTRSRSVLGAMNDFAFCAQPYFLEPFSLDLVGAALRLSEMPSKPIGYSSPDRVVRALFGGGAIS